MCTYIYIYTSRVKILVVDIDTKPRKCFSSTPIWQIKVATYAIILEIMGQNRHCGSKPLMFYITCQQV